MHRKQSAKQAAEAVTERKFTKYAARYHALGWDFSVFAVSSSGHVYAEAARLVDRLAASGQLAFFDCLAQISAAAVYSFASALLNAERAAGDCPPPSKPTAYHPVDGVPVLLPLAARLFAPGGVAELTAVILELLASDALRQELTLAGTARAAEFSWSHTARLIQSVYAQAIEQFCDPSGEKQKGQLRRS